MTLLTETGFLQSESGIPSLLQETRVWGKRTRLERSVLSTRVWGKQDIAAAEYTRMSTVHTCVGEARYLDTYWYRRGYCPHVCGGSCFRPKRVRRDRVLSTRVWGKHSRSSSKYAIICTVHTCVGEACSLKKSCIVFHVLSTRVWGKLSV